VSAAAGDNVLGQGDIGHGWSANLLNANRREAETQTGAGPGGQLLHVYFHPREIPGLLDGDGPAIAASYELRAMAMADDFTDGITPDVVKPFRARDIAKTLEPLLAARSIYRGRHSAGTSRFRPTR